MKIKINDKVKILKGKDSGKEGKVIQVFKDDNKVVVEGLNIMKKHLRARRENDKGQAIELSAPMRVDNVQLLCPKCGRATRIAVKLEAGTKKRACQKCKEIID